jgi:signal transduction histidine kinase
MVLLLGGLVVAQLVTLFLTLILPPAPQAQYNLEDVAAVLAGRTPASEGGKSLTRSVEASTPQISGPGWLSSEKSRADLAHMVGADPADVMLSFYTPLPFAGITEKRRYTMADDGFVPASFGAETQMRPAGLILAQFQPPPGGGGGFPAGPAPSMQGFPPPGNQPFPSDGRDMQRPSRHPDGRAGVPGGPAAGSGNAAKTRTPRNDRVLQPESSVSDVPSNGRLPAAPPPAPSDSQSANATRTYGPPRPPSLPPQGAGGGAPPAGRGVQPALIPPRTTIVPSDTMVTTAPARERVREPIESGESEQPAPAPVNRVAAPASDTVAQYPAEAVPTPAPMPATVSAAAPERQLPTAPQTVVGPPERRSLFGLAPAPYVEGDFIAALRLADGRWAVVHPRPEPFPNAWQRRILLWFAISLALVAPFGWLFTRRLVKPLKAFAQAAEQLGRDPSATIVPLHGPAEIGRAAHAFNLMQNRLRSFVDDRTAMVGAISHDLRTPLTRMRFRIEDVPDDVREGLLDEVDEMEAMITQVIEFIRDASTPGARERLDLRTLVDDVVEDARLVGADVTVERADPAQVEVDVLGMRRLLDNLLENAVKYGQRARVRLTTDQESAVAEIIDDGPGLPEDELERVFEPFYRSEAARASDKAGSGLGLAVCRSIARAHGGDVRLLRSNDGFLAQIRVPLAYGTELAA